MRSAITHAPAAWSEAGLELVEQPAASAGDRPALLFVHGINVGAWVWQDHFLPWFAAAGFDAFALSLRGHGRSKGVEHIREWRLADYVADVDAAVARIGRPVVLIGHSMGGAVVQRFVREGGVAAGMALLASVPPWGLAPSAMRMAMTAPHLLPDLSALLSGEMPRIKPDLLRDALFPPGTPSALLHQFAARAGPESPWMAIDTQGWPPIAPVPWQVPATFVLGGTMDRLIPVDEVWRTALYYGCAAQIVPGMAHAVMVDPRWEEAARPLMAWLLRCFG